MVTLTYSSVWFGKFCKVFVAMTKDKAEEVLSRHKIDIILSDINLCGISGIDLANEYKVRYPDTTICLWTNSITTVYRELRDGIECIQKTGVERLTVPPIMNFWLLNNLTKEANNKRARILQQLPFKHLVEVESRKVINGLESLEMRLTRNDQQLYIPAVAYRHPNHPEQIDAGVPLGRGCRGKCRMCLITRITEHVTSLTAPEIIAPVLHILDSHKALGFFTGKYHLSIGYTCGDDPIYCWEELCKAIEMIDAVKDLNASHIITTIGNSTVFKKMLPQLNGHKVKIYLSGHSTDKAKRDWLMPATKRQSLEKTVMQLSEHAWLTWQNFTYCHLLIKGFNDSPEEADGIANLLAGLPCDVKVMTIADGCLPEYPEKVTEQDGLDFVELLKQRGVDARYRENIGSEGTVSCGKHLTTNDRAIADNLTS